MARYTCTDCQRPIENGQAHIRSVMFQQVAWCRVCWAIRHEIAEWLAAA